MSGFRRRRHVVLGLTHARENAFDSIFTVSLRARRVQAARVLSYVHHSPPSHPCAVFSLVPGDRLPVRFFSQCVCTFVPTGPLWWSSGNRFPCLSDCNPLDRTVTTRTAVNRDDVTNSHNSHEAAYLHSGGVAQITVAAGGCQAHSTRRVQRLGGARRFKNAIQNPISVNPSIRF